MTAATETYEQWMGHLDDLVVSMVGLSILDLADFPSRDWFEGGATPMEAARELLEEEGLDLDFEDNL